MKAAYRLQHLAPPACFVLGRTPFGLLQRYRARQIAIFGDQFARQMPDAQRSGVRKFGAGYFSARSFALHVFAPRKAKRLNVQTIAQAGGAVTGRA
jgi:hypothetical protein